jgi:hypothetical protein
MKTVCAVWAVWCAFGAAPAWADDALGEPALRLPGEAGAGHWARASQQALRLWASDLSDRLTHPRLPALRWRADGASLSGTATAAARPIQLERTRSALTAHWQPWALGAWRVGASLGLSRALPNAAPGTSGFAAMPMASYEQPHYRVNLGLVAPRGEREPTLLVGLSVPLR